MTHVITIVGGQPPALVGGELLVRSQGEVTRRGSRRSALPQSVPLQLECMQVLVFGLSEADRRWSRRENPVETLQRTESTGFLVNASRLSRSSSNVADDRPTPERERQRLGNKARAGARLGPQACFRCSRLSIAVLPVLAILATQRTIVLRTTRMRVAACGSARVRAPIDSRCAPAARSYTDVTTSRRASRKTIPMGNERKTNRQGGQMEKA